MTFPPQHRHHPPSTTTSSRSNITTTNHTRTTLIILFLPILNLFLSYNAASSTTIQNSYSSPSSSLLSSSSSSSSSWIRTSCKCSSSIITAFAAGGGFGSASKKKQKDKKSKRTTTTTTSGGFGISSTKPNNNNNNKKKKKKKGNLFDDIPIPPSPSPPPPQEEEEEEKGPKLDRFGLPIQTEDDIFPPLPPETELLPVENINDDTITLNDLKEATKDHLGIDYSYFDEHGVEKTEKEKEHKMKLRLLHKSPPVIAIDNFFTEEECTECLQLATPTTTTTTTTSQKNLKINSATFSTALAQSKRTSTTWFCHYSQLPTLLAKTTKLLNVPLQQLEEPQVVRYRTGEEFSWHYDEIPTSQLDNGGQRLATLLVYLNTLDQGGATVFRDLYSSTSTTTTTTTKEGEQQQLAMKPKKGSALLFFPSYKDGTPDDRTLHKGEVAVDEKMIAQIWIHEREYRPVVPEGNSHEEAVEVVKRKCEELGYSSSSSE